MANKISATGTTADAARNNLNLELMRNAGKAKPVGGMKIKKNPNGTYTAEVKVIIDKR